jgi:hypothetical protein
MRSSFAPAMPSSILRIAMAFARNGERAAALGFDGKAVVAEAEARQRKVHKSRPPLMPCGRSQLSQPNGRKDCGSG